MINLIILSLILTSCSTVQQVIVKPNSPAPVISEKVVEVNELYQICLKDLSTLPGPTNSDVVEKTCQQVAQIEACKSTNGLPIFHMEKVGRDDQGTKILAFGMIHGDEPASGSVVRAWMERLESINPRNSWRLIPLLNPDGRKLATRGNANKVDLNRNFPSRNWDKEAKKYWNRNKFDVRRYPGASAASESETQCAIAHINEYKPDLIVAVHAPYGILDFDGPSKLDFPKYSLIPWRRLGHFPGSLGRYMWRDHKIPVLTVELKGSDPIRSMKALDGLQDITGILSIMSSDHLSKKQENDDQVDRHFSGNKK